MDKNTVKIIYWTGTGNTQMMADLIAEGLKACGKKPEIIAVSDITADALKDEEVFALGCPAMGDEVLEEMEMEPFVMEVEGFASGKKIGLFGAYGWGDGEWMRQWEERMKQAGAVLVGDEGVIARDTPDEEAQEGCRKLGELLAKA
ncbi:flavodoxin [Anaerolentibacter hominis]|uniref:flavodoxin n=1 Tax=Anaerolentibacter hominis TaxID=3079009 RepID=UPI0031B87827